MPKIATLDQVHKLTPHARFQVVEVQFGAANTDVDVKHTLTPADPDMIDYQVLQASGPGIVYHDTSPTRVPWKAGIVRLRSPITNLKARILLTISASPSKFEGGGASNIALTDAANIFSANQRVNAGLGVNVAPGAAGTLSLSDGIFERSRATKMGEGVDVAYNASNFTATGGGTWTVEAGDQSVFRYTIVGKVYFFTIVIDSTSISGTVNNVKISLPVAALKTTQMDVLLFDNSSNIRTPAWGLVAGGSSLLQIQKNDGTNFTSAPGNNNTWIRAVFFMEIA